MESSTTNAEQKRRARKRSNSSKGKYPHNNKKRRLERRRSQLGGSSSDPLNLEACPSSATNDTPALPNHHLGDQPAPLPEQLHHDPLNLEGKIENFESLVSELQQLPQPSVGGGRGGAKKRKRPRKKSHSESSSSEAHNNTSATQPTYNPKSAIYRYGNYTQYYGYRNSGSYWDDPRLKLLKREWFEGKEILDVGSNTGHVTIAIGQRFSPLRITGVDIDTKLVRIAWKNLQRHNVPMVTPEGQPFPKSLMMSFIPTVITSDEREEEGERGKGFPNNVFFKQVW